jgi:hypothetical protein
MGVAWSQFSAPHQQRFESNNLGYNVQAFWRPCQFDYNNGALFENLTGITGGQFVELVAGVQGSASVFRHDGTGSLSILDWNAFTVFDPNTEQVLTTGLRRKSKTVAFSNKTGRWREVSEPDTSIHGNAHWYGRSAFDGEKIMWGEWLYDPADSSYINFKTLTGFAFARESPLQWWPEYGTAGGWFAANNGNPVVWDVALEETVSLGSTGHGQHATGARHPLTGQILLCGGTGTGTWVTLIETDGTFARVADAPTGYNLSSLPLYFSPTQLCWIRPKEDVANSPLLTYWPEQDVWQEETATNPG